MSCWADLAQQERGRGMTKRIWPFALMIGSNIIYHISAKEIPSDMDAFASLTVTYAVACVMTFICFFIFKKVNGSKSFVEECRKSNWAPFALGIVIGAAVDDNTLKAIIANHIGVLLQEIETESLNVEHYSGR